MVVVSISQVLKMRRTLLTAISSPRGLFVWWPRYLQDRVVITVPLVSIQGTHNASSLAFYLCHLEFMTCIQRDWRVRRIIFVAAHSQFVCSMHRYRQWNDLSPRTVQGLAGPSKDASSAPLLVLRQWLVTGTNLAGPCITSCSKVRPHERHWERIVGKHCTMQEKILFMSALLGLEVFG